MTAPSGRPPSVLDLEDSALAGLVSRIRAGEPPAGWAYAPGPVHATFRAAGRSRGLVWLPRGDFGPALKRLLQGAAALGADHLQLDFCHRFRPIGRRLVGAVFRNAQGGRIGLQIRYDRHLERHPPSAMIANNRGFARVLELFFARHALDEAGFYEGGGTLDAFDARQVLLDLGAVPGARTLFRGSTLVAPADVNHPIAEQMIGELGGWLGRQLEPSGRMPYAWWPSAGVAPDADNTVRQFMATLALVRLANRGGGAVEFERAERNLAANLKRFYLCLSTASGEIGLISYAGSAKLGAAALAALAILEAPFRDRYEEQLEALHAGILALREGSGRLRSFQHPAGRAYDNQNFYPGEAQLYLATRLRLESDPDLLPQTLETAAWYRRWHLENRNPAFVPWHTQANALLFEISGETWLRDFVFEMNDWLLPLQQWADAPAPDFAGRFYAPGRPAFGPPHASSTGVYLEGLADALRLASDAGDSIRAAAYRRAIWRGLRSLRQLQFKDDTELYYISQRERVRGALRTEAYDNRIRIDNVQHALMALLKLTALPAFHDHPPVWS